MAQTSFVGASLGACTMLLSPVVGIVVTKIGYKWTGWVGTMLPIAAMAACYLVDNFLTFQIGYGFVMGVGMCFLFLPAKTCIAFFFQKKCSLATGIAVSGGGLGYIVMPKVHLQLLQTFGINGIFIGNAVLTACLIPLIHTFYPNQTEVKERCDLIASLENIDIKHNESNWKVVKLPLFWLFILAAFFTGVYIVRSGYSLPLNNLNNFYTKDEFPFKVEVTSVP